MYQVGHVPGLPKHVAAHAHDVVHQGVPLHHRNHQPLPADEEPDSTIQLKREVKHGETGIGYKTFEDAFFFPLLFITQNTKMK